MSKTLRVLAVVAAGTLAALVGVDAAAAPPAPTAPSVPSVSSVPTVSSARHHHAFSAAAKRLGRIADPRQRAIQTSDPGALLKAYNVKPLWDKGIDGSGRTVTTIVSIGDKNIKSYLDSYSRQNGLPPADLQVIEPAGKVPDCTQTPDPQDCAGWAGEVDLDVAMIHTMAPRAKIVVAATPTLETQGLDGFPEMMKAIDYLVDTKATDVISMSLGTVEQDFDNPGQFTDLDSHFARAAAAGVSVVVSTGDEGATGYHKDGQTMWNKRVATWPATEPTVTAVGGTELTLDRGGNRTAPDSEINFSGAGESSSYPVPDWQAGVAKTTGATHRSYPDISLEGIDGTSESAPLFAGVVALAAQSAGRPLGQVTPALYRLGADATRSGLVDVTTGDSGYAGVDGYRAGPGFDIESGWGTLDAATFVPALAKAAGQ